MMQITSTNIAKPTTIIWNEQEITTGIYKNPTNKPLFLGKHGVKNDEVSDLSVHGGEFKACYLFSEDHYKYWKSRYPNLEWNYGMFGENLTVRGLDETKLIIGNIYKVGNAFVQISQPREPCFKLGIKFGNQHVLKQFIYHKRPGTYIRVLEEGTVKKGDTFELIKKATNSLTIVDFFQQLYVKEKDQELIKRIIHNEALPPRKQVQFLNYMI